MLLGISLGESERHRLLLVLCPNQWAYNDVFLGNECLLGKGAFSIVFRCDGFIAIFLSMNGPKLADGKVNIHKFQTDSECTTYALSAESWYPQ